MNFDILKLYLLYRPRRVLHYSQFLPYLPHCRIPLCLPRPWPLLSRTFLIICSFTSLWSNSFSTFPIFNAPSALKRIFLSVQAINKYLIYLSKSPDLRHKGSLIGQFQCPSSSCLATELTCIGKFPWCFKLQDIIYSNCETVSVGCVVFRWPTIG